MAMGQWSTQLLTLSIEPSSLGGDHFHQCICSYIAYMVLLCVICIHTQYVFHNMCLPTGAGDSWGTHPSSLRGGP